ncbi:very long chain fatty acid elongase 7-like [Rhodnius prolixus]|uniref:very long chain fatty acid elongase 7-like n=1 Tax=Rhodnius prolixus TaxID=13249 RepID=UPI003D18B9ED
MDTSNANLGSNHSTPLLSNFDGAVSVDTYLKSLPSIYSPPMVPVIVAIYLSLVLVILPWYMAHRQPYKLQTFLHLYNVGQIMMNIGLCYMYTELMNYQPLKVWDNICAFVTSTNGANDDWVYLKIIQLVHMYCINKTLDLIDTIIFCLKKKHSQVTFLHVYHHVVMVLSSFITVYYLRVELSTTLIALNSLVHVIMYTYYFLSNLGPSVRKYLWWKRHVTKLQILQFLLALTLLGRLQMEGCKQASHYAVMWGFTVATVLFLFCDFYKKAYIKKTA